MHMASHSGFQNLLLGILSSVQIVRQGLMMWATAFAGMFRYRD